MNCFSLKIWLVFFFFGTISAFGEPAFKATILNGTAKIQLSSKKTWSKFSVNDQVRDNDILETYFQTKLVLELDKENILILGSNSKALINLAETESNIEINITLFSGGLFLKSVKNCRANVFTSHGVAQIDSGVISCVVDGKSGQTGFQVLGGVTNIRNIAQQEATPLTAGQTTVVTSGKEPTAPVYVTLKHITVLRYYFGNEYIENELQASNINPTDDRQTTRLSLSQSTNETKTYKNSVPFEGSYKPLFNIVRIYESILNDRVKHSRMFQDISTPILPPDNRVGEVYVGGSFGFTNDQVYPVITAVPSVTLPWLNAGIRIPFSKMYDGTYSLNFNGANGITDKIDHLYIGSLTDSMYLFIGPINNLTFGSGTVVQNYSNKNSYSALNTAGLVVHLRGNPVNVKAFVNDITTFDIGGVSLAIEPSFYRFAGSFFYDLNQYAALPTDNYSRFIELPQNRATLVPDPDSAKAVSYIYEIDFGTEIINTYDVLTNVLVEFAQKFEEGHTVGWAFRGPTVTYERSWIKIAARFNAETGHMISPQFHSFYTTNRNRRSNVGNTTTQTTQNAIFSDDRFAAGVTGILGIAPVRGLSFVANITHDFTSVYPFLKYETIDSTFSKNNFSFDFRIAANDSLIKKIRLIEAHYTQIHGGYFPIDGSAFASWGIQAGLSIVTAPLFLKASIEAGLNFQYLDIDKSSLPQNRFNGTIDAGDQLVEVYAGVRWGF
jgi:hypothetical protein